MADFAYIAIRVSAGGGGLLSFRGDGAVRFAIILLPSSVALLWACSAFVYFEVRTYQDDMRSEQLTLARIIAESR